MTNSRRDSLIEVPREGMGPVSQFVPDTPWSTATVQALQTRTASVWVDQLQHPRNLIVHVRGGTGPGDHDQAYLFGLPNSHGLRAYVSGIERPTEFIVDDDLVPLVMELHPGASPREAISCWFENLELPPAEVAPVPIRRLRTSDADAAMALIPPWAFRTFASPRDMILGGGCYAVELNGKIASIAYVADQSVKYARLAAFTDEQHRRKGYAFAAVRRLMEHVIDDGRLACALVPRRNAPAVHFALKLKFPSKALLRTLKVVPNGVADTSPGGQATTEITSSSTQSQG